MHEDLKWLFGLIFVFGALWFASGGYNAASSNDPYIKPLPPVGTGETYGNGVSHVGNNSSGYYTNTYYYGGQEYPSYSPTQNQNANNPTTIAQSLAEAGMEAEKIKQEIAKLQEASYASPLKNKLTIVNVNAGGSTQNESITIRASDTNTEKILITGLRLQSAPSGRGANIPKAVYIYYQNQINFEEPLYLAPGETAYIITGRSPIGTSFRGNKCSGFLNQYQNLGLPYRCPSPSKDLLPLPANIYSDICLDYIESLSGCEVITQAPRGVPPECVSYAQREISHTKCVDRHRSESDFYDHEWRVYLGRDSTLWKSSRELIHLEDQNGKIIDSVTF